MTGDKSEGIRVLKHKISGLKHSMNGEKRALGNLTRSVEGLVKDGLKTKEARREHFELVQSRDDVLDQIKNDMKKLADLNDELAREERTPLEWLWYILTSPFRRLWNLLKRLTGPLTSAAGGEGVEYLALELAEEAVIL